MSTIVKYVPSGRYDTAETVASGLSFLLASQTGWSFANSRQEIVDLSVERDLDIKDARVWRLTIEEVTE